MVPPTLTAQLEICLRERFNLAAFRGLQEAVILRVLAGRDVLALMPTGAGKSLCYQLPAVLLPGLTVVVSPLLALMRDQLRRLQVLSIASCALSGAFDQHARAALGLQLKQGTLKVLLLSPERLLGEGFLAWLRTHLGPAGLSLLVIDEAHCISDWGQAFRPVYLRLGCLRTFFPHAPLLAMTASADAAVRSVILGTLRMHADSVLLSSFDRPELFYRVAISAAPWRHAVAYLQHYHAADSAIFYCQRRREAELLTYFLRQQGISAHYYHAGRSAQQRLQVEKWFRSRPDAVIAATIAFGLGVDKPDVRLVVHRGIARDASAYYQETGRAGRDGKDADALLMLDAEPAQHGRVADEPIAPSSLQVFARTERCRRAKLLETFGERYVPPCGRCDRCDPSYRPMPALRTSQARWVRQRAAS